MVKTKMTKCSECKHTTKVYDADFDMYWYKCNLDGAYIEEDVAEDETYPCDFYEYNGNDDATKRA